MNFVKAQRLQKVLHKHIIWLRKYTVTLAVADAAIFRMSADFHFLIAATKFHYSCIAPGR